MVLLDVSPQSIIVSLSLVSSIVSPVACDAVSCMISPVLVSTPFRLILLSLTVLYAKNHAPMAATTHNQNNAILSDFLFLCADGDAASFVVLSACFALFIVFALREFSNDV